MKIVCRPDATSVQGFGEALTLREAVTVACRVGSADCSAELEPTIASQNVDDESWEILMAFAHRTYAPATDESRLAGAGAGLNDND